MSIAGQTLVYFGDGKGKTTSAFGVALRAVGRGWKVLMIQYTKMGEWPKGEPMGEIHGAKRLAPDFEVISTGIGFVNIFGDTFTMDQHREAAQEGLELYRERAASGDYDLIILDEAIGAVSQGQWDLEQVGFPGAWPYTRGVHATGHRGRLWTMRMFAGFGNAEETNERFKYLLANGNAGLSVAYDMPTLYGYDTDDPQAEGEFGTCGVAVSSLADMEVLFDGIPLDEVTTSMTINSPAAMIWAMYLVNAEKRGIAWDKLSGTTQNDILKEYIAQKEYIFPPRPSTKLVVDTFEFGAQRVPRWNTISISV